MGLCSGSPPPPLPTSSGLRELIQAEPAPLEKKISFRVLCAIGERLMVWGSLGLVVVLVPMGLLGLLLPWALVAVTLGGK